MKPIIIKPSFSIFLLIVALILGFLWRIYGPLTNISISGADSYVHFMGTKAIVNGHFFMGNEWDWAPKAFYILPALINFYSGIDLYTIFRFIGPILGTAFVGAVYCFAKNITNDDTTGSFSAIASAVVWGLTTSGGLVFANIDARYEVLGFIIMPLVLLFAYKLITEYSHSKIIKSTDFILYIVSSVLLGLIHPPTMLITSYLLLILFILSLIIFKDIRELKVYILGSIIILFGILSTIGYYFALSQNGVFLGSQPTSSDIKIENKAGFVFKIVDIVNYAISPTIKFYSFDSILILIISIFLSYYGLIRKKLDYSFIGISGIFISYMLFTNSFNIHGWDRVSPYHAFIASLVIGVTIKWSSDLEKITEFSKKFTLKINTIYIILYSILTVGIVYYLLKLYLSVFGRQFILDIGYNHPARVSALIALLVGLAILVILSGKINRRILKINLGSNKLYQSSVYFFALAIIISPSINLAVSEPDFYETGYQDLDTFTLGIGTNYSLNNTIIYSEKIYIYWVNKERALIYPYGKHYELHELLNYSPSDYTPDNQYVFIYIEKNLHPLRIKFEERGEENERKKLDLPSSREVMNKSIDWITEYTKNHNNINKVYESENISVWLIIKKND